MSTAWIVIAGSATGVYAFKAAGPLLLGGRNLPPWLHRWTALLPAALLAALVAVSTPADGRHLTVLFSRRWAVEASALGLLVLWILLVGENDVVPFIYFQF